jgi:hypothetical protein
MDITSWIEWFLGCLCGAIDGAQETLSAILAKARFCDSTKDVTLNDRQRNVVNRCWTDSKASSRPPNKQRLPRAHRTELIGHPGTDRAWRPGSEFRRRRSTSYSLAITNHRACARDCHRKAENLPRARGEVWSPVRLLAGRAHYNSGAKTREQGRFKKQRLCKPRVDKNNHL